MQAVGGFEDMTRARDEARPHRFERFEVRRDRSPRREIAAGRREMRASTPGEQRSEQQDGAAQPPDEGAVGLVLRHLGTADPKRRAADALDLRAEIEQKPRHHFDVADARHVREDAFLGRQQARGQQRQRGILVTFDFHGTGEPMAALDD
jgi:hypothetical protein